MCGNYTPPCSVFSTAFTPPLFGISHNTLQLNDLSKLKILTPKNTSSTCKYWNNFKQPWLKSLFLYLDLNSWFNWHINLPQITCANETHEKYTKLHHTPFLSFIKTEDFFGTIHFTQDWYPPATHPGWNFLSPHESNHNQPLAEKQTPTAPAHPHHNQTRR